MELIQFASKVPVIGGLSKLIKNFTRQNQTDVISYCDLRWGTGEGYRKAGFEFMSDTSPGYFYTDFQNRYNRLSFTKQKLIKQGYLPDNTEHEIMYSIGMRRVWDCGHRKFIYRH
jgi:hypothetical protein